MSASVEIDDASLLAAMERLRAGSETVARAGERAAAGSAASRTRAALPKRSGRLAGSVRTSSSSSGAVLSMSAPYAGWIEYGGTRGRPYDSAGRYMGAATEDSDRELAQICERGIEGIAL